MAKLILKFKEAFIKEIPLDREVTTIGRAPGNDIVIDNLAVSSFHAKIIRERGRHVIEDLNSTNGTFVQDRRVSSYTLTDNAIVTVGKHTLVYQDPQEIDEEATINIRKPQLVAESTVIIDGQKIREELEASSGAVRDGKTWNLAEEKKELLGAFTVIEGRAERKEYELRSRVTTIGKSDTAEIRLKGFFAPKIAALVNRTKDGYYLNPAGGGKRPLINGRQIESACLLKNLDFVEVGNLKLQFYLKD